MMASHTGRTLSGSVAFLLGSLLVIPPVCLATPSVGAPVALPDSFPPGFSVEVLVTCHIVSNPGDPAVVPAGVYLQRVNANNQFVATLGIMRDDGANGDAVAGDGIFSLRITVNESAPGVLYVRVSAPFRGLVRRLFSGVSQIQVLEDLVETWTIDDDSDQFSENQKDCNDADPAIHPQAPEVCNGADDNCNGQVDEGL
jgi:hypothetical protein